LQQTLFSPNAYFRHSNSTELLTGTTVQYSDLAAKLNSIITTIIIIIIIIIIITNTTMNKPIIMTSAAFRTFLLRAASFG